MPTSTPKTSLFRRTLALFGWTRASSVLLGGFFLIIFLILYVWWPLAEQVLAIIDWSGKWWLYMDWLLVGVFFFMSLTIIVHADLRRDALIVFVATVGGLVIESWGTQTNLWFYYTAERPPLWIVPAWPIATLSIDRIMRALNWGIERLGLLLTHPPCPRFDRVSTGSTCQLSAAPALAGKGLSSNKLGVKTHSRKNYEDFLSFAFKIIYWLIFIVFYGVMLYFVAPTLDKSFTLMALLLCAFLIITPTDYRHAVLVFVAGSGLGYFLELWGTTRQCWTYYTFQTPPFFAVLAHGMAAVAFWRAGLVMKKSFQVIWNRKEATSYPPTP